MKKVMAFNQVAEFLAGEMTGNVWYMMLVGCEGSGKTTLSKKLKKEHGSQRVSIDRIFKKNPLLQFYPENLHDEYIRKLRSKLSKRVNVVDDGKKLSQSERQRALRVVRKFPGVHIAIVHMDIPLETCVAWNAKRKDSAPRWVVDYSRRNLERPSKDEGRVIRLRPVGDWKYEVIEE